MEFEHWVRVWFDRPEGWDWIRAEDLPFDLPAAEVIAHATRLFENAGAILKSYSDSQVGTGLYALIHESDSPLYALQNTSVPLEDRCRCLQSISSVYRDVFAPRCREYLGHRSDPSGPLNGTCYMWWDIFPTYGGILADAENAAVLGTMEQALALPHAACQESALHGLGHWAMYCPKQVHTIVDSFLNSGQARRPELLSYARNARSGQVL